LDEEKQILDKIVCLGVVPENSSADTLHNAGVAVKQQG
jgi:hypothetical protein